LDILHCPSAVSKDFVSDYAAVHHDREAPIDITNNGVFFLNSRIRHEQVADGLSNTLFLGEKAADDNDLGWMSGTRATLRNTAWGPAAPPNLPTFPRNADGLPVLTPASEQELAPKGAPGGTSKPNAPRLYVGGFGGPHPGGAIYAFGDGSIRFLSESIDPPMYRRLGNRDDGQLLDLGWY
jgi:prepilin-type processing-associated H-X9-DG protein